MLALEPNLTNMDPITSKMLLAEREEKAIVEEDE